MKLKDTFVTQEMDGEQVMVEAGGGFAGMVRSNATAAFIIDQLKTETTKEAILDAMCKKYDAPPRCDGRGCGHGAGQPEKNWCAGCVNRPLRRRSRTMAFCFTAM